MQSSGYLNCAPCLILLITWVGNVAVQDWPYYHINWGGHPLIEEVWNRVGGDKQRLNFECLLAHTAWGYPAYVCLVPPPCWRHMCGWSVVSHINLVIKNFRNKCEALFRRKEEAIKEWWDPHMLSNFIEDSTMHKQNQTFIMADSFSC